MFKIVEVSSKPRIFETWAGCLEHMKLLERQGRGFTLYEKLNGKWVKQ